MTQYIKKFVCTELAEKCMPAACPYVEYLSHYAHIPKNC